MTSLTVTLRYGSTPTSGTVEAIPRTMHGVVPGDDIMALGPWRVSINGTGTLGGQGTLTFPADQFTDLTWSFRIRWDSGDKTLTFGPYTYAQISADGVDSLADLIEVEVLEYVATSTLVQRVEALEAGGGGGGTTLPAGGTAGQYLTPTIADPDAYEWLDLPPGPTGPAGPAGADGSDGADGVGVPIGGTTGQVLAKASATDYDTEWTDAPSGGGGGGGPLTGTGSPEGVVTAPVTTEYVDTAATNGAVSWVKASGTGNTGWRVTYGDTGWRRVDSANLVKGYMLIRRVNSTVYIGFRGGDFDSVEVASASGQTIINSQPTGFTSLAAYVEAMSRDGAAFNGFVYVGEELIIFRGMTQVTLIRPGLCIHPTADPWPSTLPGIPA